MNRIAKLACTVGTTLLLLAATLFWLSPTNVAIAQPAASATAKPATTAAPAVSSAAPSPAKSAAPATTGAAPATAAGTAAPAPGSTGVPATAGAPAIPGSAGAATPTPPPASTTMDGQTYAVRLRDLEQKIDELKEQIRRSHTRLSLLSDTILSGGGAGARTVIRFKNDLSDAFRITRALVVLDGAVQYNKSDQSGALSEQTEIPVFNGSIPPGDHTVQVLMNVQGHGYGVFSYLRGYKFDVRSSHSFTAVEGKTVQLDAILYEKGGVTTPLEERPNVRYVEKIVSGLADPTAPIK